MTSPRGDDIADVLRAASGGEPGAAARLLPLVYEELRRLAESYLRRLPPGQTLQATALVHEAYLRLNRGRNAVWDGRGHFFGAAARAIREILIEQARRKGAIKHGGGRRRQPIEAGDLPIESPPEGALALNEALTDLEIQAPRAHEVVMLRYYAGLSSEEAADVLRISGRTAERDWRFARAWLHERLHPQGERDRAR